MPEMVGHTVSWIVLQLPNRKLTRKNGFRIRHFGYTKRTYMLRRDFKYYLSMDMHSAWGCMYRQGDTRKRLDKFIGAACTHR